MELPLCQCPERHERRTCRVCRSHVGCARRATRSILPAVRACAGCRVATASRRGKQTNDAIWWTKQRSFIYSLIFLMPVLYNFLRKSHNTSCSTKRKTSSQLRKGSVMIPYHTGQGLATYDIISRISKQSRFGSLDTDIFVIKWKNQQFLCSFQLELPFPV